MKAKSNHSTLARSFKEENLRYASNSRCFDSLIHVHKLDDDWSWYACAVHTARCFWALWAMVCDQECRLEQIDNLAKELMFSLLRWPLMGRPSVARNTRRDFEMDIHCYWAKFPFNTSLQLLLRELPAHQAVIKHLLKEYTFIGPAPRYLLAELKGAGFATELCCYSTTS